MLGAGPMGLAAAYELVKQGYAPVIYEADDRVGGMTAAFDFSGLSIERFYHFHCTSDTGFIDMLDELGIGEKLHWTETKMAYWYKGKLQPWGNPFALLRFDGLGLVAKFRYGLFAFLCTKRNNWLPLDNVNAKEWVSRWVGLEAYEVLWRKLFEYKFHNYVDNLSAAWIWSRIRRLGRSRYNLFREKLGYLENGSETFLNATKSYIEKNGGIIRLGSPVSKVHIRDGKIWAVETDGILERYERVISTIPLPFVPHIIPDLPPDIIKAYRSVENIAVVCVIAKLTKALSENFWVNINDPEMDIPGLVEYTNLQPLNDHIVYVPFYLPGDHPNYLQPDEWYTARVAGYLKTINPELTDVDILAIRASRYRFAQPICEPGFSNKLPAVELPIQGLWVADTSYYYPEDRGISESIDFGRKLAAMATEC
ncbi:MAG: NAD(P)/FAD-dependent oxidoreductase [Halieaceae bacterium]